MSIKDFNYLGKESNVTSIDYIGQKFGVYRNQNESLVDFKYRCLSASTYPSSISNSGQSSGHGRALGHPPKDIGYIKIDPELRIYFNGYELNVYWANSIEGERELLLSYKITDHKTIETFKNDFEALSANNEVVIDEEKYLTKDLCFLMPFVNFGTAKKSLLGGNYIMPGTLDLVVLPDSIRGKGSFLKNKVNTPEEVLEIGDFYYDEVTRSFHLFDNDDRELMTVIYSYYHKYLPLVYCPVMSYRISPIIASSNALIDYNNLAPDAFVGSENPEILDLAFFSKLVNAGWKANETSAVAVNGTYYDK